MPVFNTIRLIVFLATAVWLVPSIVGGLITAFALQREKASIDRRELFELWGRLLGSCILGGLVVFITMLAISLLMPEGLTGMPPMALEFFSFGVGNAVIGAIGAKIILSVLETKEDN